MAISECIDCVSAGGDSQYYNSCRSLATKNLNVNVLLRVLRFLVDFWCQNFSDHLSIRFFLNMAGHLQPLKVFSKGRHYQEGIPLSQDLQRLIIADLVEQGAD